MYGQTEYAGVQKELETELARLRKELKVPDPDPPETIIRPRPKKKCAEEKVTALVSTLCVGMPIFRSAERARVCRAVAPAPQSGEVSSHAERGNEDSRLFD